MTGGNGTYTPTTPTKRKSNTKRKMKNIKEYLGCGGELDSGLRKILIELVLLEVPEPFVLSYEVIDHEIYGKSVLLTLTKDGDTQRQNPQWFVFQKQNPTSYQIVNLALFDYENDILEEKAFLDVDGYSSNMGTKSTVEYLKYSFCEIYAAVL